MTAQGIITKIDDDIITLEQLADEECASCTASDSKNDAKGCKACGLMVSSKKHFLKAVNTQKINLTIGDRVSIYLPPGKAILGSLFIFIVPLAAFIGFFMLSGVIFPGFGDAGKAIAGITGIALWYGIYFVISRLRKKKDWPVVSKKLNTEE